MQRQHCGHSQSKIHQVAVERGRQATSPSCDASIGRTSRGDRRRNPHLVGDTGELGVLPSSGRSRDFERRRSPSHRRRSIQQDRDCRCRRYSRRCGNPNRSRLAGEQVRRRAVLHARSRRRSARPTPGTQQILDAFAPPTMPCPCPRRVEVRDRRRTRPLGLFRHSAPPSSKVTCTPALNDGPSRPSPFLRGFSTSVISPSPERSEWPT